MPYPRFPALFRACYTVSNLFGLHLLLLLEIYDLLLRPFSFLSSPDHTKLRLLTGSRALSNKDKLLH